MSIGSKLRRFPSPQARDRQSKDRPRRSPKEGGPVEDFISQLHYHLIDEGPPICIVNHAGDFLYANDAFERIKRALASAGALPEPLGSAGGTAETPSDTRIALELDNRREIFCCETLLLKGWSGNARAFIYRPAPPDVRAHETTHLLSSRLEDITRLVSDWVWETDRDFNFTFVSARVTEAVGAHPRELEGRHLLEAFAEAPQRLEAIVASGGRAPFRDIEVVIPHRGGDKRTFRLSGLPVYENGRFKGLRGTAADVTDLRAREAALVEAKEAAELANRTKTEFVANMSHELRTPLNAVIGFSEIMHQELLGPLGNEQYKSYAGDIHESAGHLLKLINDILDISKIEAGGHQIMEEEFQPADVMESVGRLIAERCYRSGQQLTVTLTKGLPNLFADERKIKQVLINLLSNANKFTPEGGKIDLTAKVEKDGSFAFRVRDNGIGIAEEDMEKAFSPFDQVDSTLARQYEGTGLGLPLSLGFMRLHGGALELESRPGEGTTVIARLPASRVLNTEV